MELYREFVKQYAREDHPNDPILNRSAHHAAVIMEYIFARAEDDVSILTGCLDVSVYGTSEVISAAVKALADHPSLNIRVLSECDLPSDHPFILNIRQNGFGERVKFAIINQEYGAPPSHFAVADGRHFRFEGNKNNCEAVVYFGNSDTGGHLLDTFNKMWATGSIATSVQDKTNSI